MRSISGFKYKKFNDKIICYYDGTKSFAEDITVVSGLDVIKVPSILTDPNNYDFRDKVMEMKTMIMTTMADFAVEDIYSHELNLYHVVDKNLGSEIRTNYILNELTTTKFGYAIKFGNMFVDANGKIYKEPKEECLFKTEVDANKAMKQLTKFMAKEMLLFAENEEYSYTPNRNHIQSLLGEAMTSFNIPHLRVAEAMVY